MLPYAQSARLCGMNFLPPLVQHSAQRAGDAELARHRLGFAQRLLAYAASRKTEPGLDFGTDDMPPEPPDVPLDARPALFSPLPEARR